MPEWNPTCGHKIPTFGCCHCIMLRNTLQISAVDLIINLMEHINKETNEILEKKKLTKDTLIDHVYYLMDQNTNVILKLKDLECQRQ